MESNSFSDLMALVVKQEQIERWLTKPLLDSPCRSNDKEVIEPGDAREDATVTDNKGMVYEVASEEVSAMVAATMSETATTIEAVTVDPIIDERVVPRVITDDGLIVTTRERPVKVSDLT